MIYVIIFPSCSQAMKVNFFVKLKFCEICLSLSNKMEFRGLASLVLAPNVAKKCD